MQEELLATVDLGSNSFRLLIAKVGEDGTLLPVDAIKETVRLASGLSSNNQISRETQLVALEVLSRFSERLAGFSKNQVRVVGTSALRIAKNAYEFIHLANKTLGFKIEVISGNEEARLIYIGATHSLSHTKEKRLVIDIGGGSTEFIIGSGYEPQIMESVTMGCVSFSENYFPNGELREKYFAEAIFAARSKIQSMEHLFAQHDWQLAIGTSGTARALYDLCVNLGFAEHITRSGLYAVKKLLIKAKNIKNLDLKSLNADRNLVIAGGLAIMLAIMEELDLLEMSIADGALREGVMYDLLGRKTNHDLRVSTIARLKKQYAIDKVQAKRVSSTVSELYSDLIIDAPVPNNDVKLLNWAAELYEIGLSIAHNDYHRHGAYILANADLAGFSRPEQGFLADLVRAHRGNLEKASEYLHITRKGKLRFLLLVLILRIAVILNRKRVSLPQGVIKVQPIKLLSKEALLNSKKITVEFDINKDWLTQNPLTLYSLHEEIKQWQQFNIRIKLLPL